MENNLNINKGKVKHFNGEKKNGFSFSLFIVRVVPNLCIVCSLLILVLLVIDKFNTIMNFIDNDITKGILFLLVALSVASSVICRVIEGKLYRIRKHKMENKTNEEQQFGKNARNTNKI